MSAFLAREALNLRYYTPLGPGPGFFPLWLAVLLASWRPPCSAATFARPSRCRSASSQPERLSPDRAVLGALVLVIALLDSLGFCLSCSISTRSCFSSWGASTRL